MQAQIEQHYSKDKIRQMMKAFIVDNIEPEQIEQGVKLLTEWINVDYYPSKNRRLLHVRDLDLSKIVVDVIVGTLSFTEESLLTNAVGQLAGLLNMDDKLASIITMSEILAVLCELDLYDLNKDDETDSWTIISLIELPEEIQDQQVRSMYLPPMIVKPEILTHNMDSGYQTQHSSLILGSGNYHEGDITLDALNIMASVPLSINIEFISTIKEEPNKEISADLILEDYPELTDEEAIEEAKFRIAMFDRFVKQSQEVCDLLIETGNKFYLNQKVDKRGRVYAQGYHVSTAGASYKKAAIELYNEEIVEGI
jgi:hypothetical protein